MSFRNRPTLDRRHRPRWQDELRSQQLVVAGFAAAIAVALGIFGATAWSSYYDNHLTEVAYVGSQSMDLDAFNLREGIISAELYAKQLDLSSATAGVQGSVVQQQLQVIQSTQQNITATTASSLTDGALVRQEAPRLGISVSAAAVDKEVTRRTTLPFRIELSVITVNALPSNAASGATPTDAEWATAESTAKDLLSQLKSGADFATLAKSKSSDSTTSSGGGLIGWVEAGDASYGTYFDAAKNAKSGDLLGPVKKGNQYAILKVDGVRQAAPDTTFNTLLASAHATQGDYRAYIQEQLLSTAFQNYFKDHVVSRYMDQQHVAQILIQPDNNGLALPMDRIRHVLIQPDPSLQDQSKATQAQWDAALATAKKVRALLVQPNADWNAIAKQYSDDPGSNQYGGDLGWWDLAATGQLDDTFRTAAARLKVGEISQPVKTQFGYHIIEKTDHREDAQAQVDKIMAELKANPASWDRIAASQSMDHATASSGGDIGWVARYEKDAAQQKAIFSLTTPGQISAPVNDGSTGIFIFKLIASQKERWMSDTRLTSLKASGFTKWRNELMTSLGSWTDARYQSTSSTTG